MKVLFDYALTYEMDIPAEKIKEILAKTDNHFEQGHLFNVLAQETSPELTQAIELFHGGEIIGVYQGFVEDDNGSFGFLEDDLDEVIWEG